MSTTNAKLDRQTFSISRELEYFSEAELTTQTGYGREDWWPGVVAKELVDNSLDACEQAGTPPRIEVDFQGDSLTVVDNGPGLEPKMLERILDFGSPAMSADCVAHRCVRRRLRRDAPDLPTGTGMVVTM